MVVEGRIEEEVMHGASFPPVLPKLLFAATCRVNCQIHHKFRILSQGVPLLSYRNTPSFGLSITSSLPTFINIWLL